MPPAPPSSPGHLPRLVTLILQVSLLSLTFALWLAVGRHLRLPLPAGLMAMLTVAALLLARVLPLGFVQQGAAFLLRYIAMLFVPICIGAVRQLPLLRTQGAAFALVLVASALIGQAVAGLLAQALCKKPSTGPAPEGLET